MTVYYSFGRDRQSDIMFNDTTRINELATDDGHHRLTVPIELKSGYNVIRMGNSYNWAPNIDRFTLAKE